jgi:hypothetical protein
MARARAASRSEPRPLDVSLTAAEPWPKRPWPPLPMMSRSTEAASIHTTRQTTALRIEGSLVYDDVQSMRTALVWDVAALRALEWTHPTDEQLVPLH